MKHSRFTDEQIIGILKEQENGLRTADVGDDQVEGRCADRQNIVKITRLWRALS